MHTVLRSLFGEGLPTPPKHPTEGLQPRVEPKDLRSNAVRGQRPAHSRETRAQQGQAA